MQANQQNYKEVLSARLAGSLFLPIQHLPDGPAVIISTRNGRFLVLYFKHIPFFFRIPFPEITGVLVYKFHVLPCVLIFVPYS